MGIALRHLALSRERFMAIFVALTSAGTADSRLQGMSRAPLTWEWPVAFKRSREAVLP